MRSIALIALFLALGLGACSYDSPPPPAPRAPAAPTPPPPPPAPPPGGMTFTGAVVSVGARCQIVAGDNGVRYAVHRPVLRGVPVGARVRVVGVVHPNQDCPGATVIRADGGVRRMGPGPGPRS